MVLTLHSALNGRMKAMCAPSGDQAGKLSRPFVVRRRRPVPSMFMVRMPTPMRANAIRLPLGEKAGAMDEYAPVVSCWSPSPAG